MPGVGDVDPSPTNIEEKFLKCVKNLQLALQLLEFNCKWRVGNNQELHAVVEGSHMIPYDSSLNAVSHSLIPLILILPLLLCIFFSVERRLATGSPFFLSAARAKRKNSTVQKWRSSAAIFSLALFFFRFTLDPLRKNRHARTWVEEHLCDTLSIVSRANSLPP